MCLVIFQDLSTRANLLSERNPHPLCIASKLKTNTNGNTHSQTQKWTRERTYTYIQKHTNTHTRSRMGAGQADWNYQARPWALPSNFQRKQILDATVIFPFNTDQESSWHVCSLPMSPFASDLCACPALSLFLFFQVNSEGDTQHSDSKIKKKRNKKTSFFPEFIRFSTTAGICAYVTLNIQHFSLKRRKGCHLIS